jgi:plasmid stability protein
VAQLTIRKLDPDLVRRLKIRAAENGRSTEAEVRAILERDFGTAGEDFWVKAARFRASLKGPFPDSAALIRKQRAQRTRHLARLIHKDRS